MAEFITLGLFLLGLGICIVFDIEVLYALFFGVFCFGGYSIVKGISARNTANIMIEGIFRIKGILTIFVLIGLLTASWRAGGTIPFIIYHGINMINPDFFVLCTFLLCCMVSFLTGTSFGTVSTVGVICMMLSNSAGFDPYFTGGAILSGIYFGDRGSPMSASAQLVAAITQTDIYDNVKRMMITGIVPFVLTCLFYLLGPAKELHAINSSTVEVLTEVFDLHWLTVMPAVLILILAAFRIDAKIAIAASVFFCCIIAVVFQGMSMSDMAETLITGYRVKENPAVASLMDGGGLLSMLRVTMIVMISSSYSGVFLHTNLLEGIKGLIKKAAGYISDFGATMVTAVFAAAVSCNQTLTVILTEQLCSRLYKDKKKYAIVLENTTIVLPPLIPWNIAGTMPLATLNLPAECLFYAVFLYLIPLCNFIFNFRLKRKKQGNSI